MRKQLRFTIILFVIGVNHIYGQNFTPIVVNNFQGVYNGESLWFDFDNDNDLDFIITGQSDVNDLHTRIYQNNGNDSFGLFSVFSGYSETGLELINANGDNFIDLIINGRKIGAGNDPTSIYINNNAAFEYETSTIDFLLGGHFASIVFKDWNNDLKEDIIITGINGFVDGNPNIETIFYTMDKNGHFISSSPINGGAYLSSLKLVDIDNDLDLDLIISGNDGEFPLQRTDLYLNEDNNFVLSDISMEPLQNSSIDIGDYNSDGYMDVVLVGYNEYLDPTTLLYKNIAGDLIGVENSGLNGHIGRSGSVQWGDYDNDGDLDLLFHGESSGEWSFEIMINEGNDHFSHLDEENFENWAYGSASWGDYDNDGDLDVLATGYTDVNDPRLIIYRNDLAVPNTAPSAPTNLVATSFEIKNVDISWESSVDNETPQVSLTYNLHVKDSESNISFSSFSDLESDFFKRVSIGNMGISTKWQFKNLDDDTYTVYVQAVDGGYKSSPFSDSSIFYIGIPITPINLSLEETDNIQLTWEDKSNNEEFFIIERKLNSEQSFVRFDSVTSNMTKFTDTELPPSFSVNYQIRARNPNGVSEYTNIVTSTIDGTPTELNVSFSSNGVRLNWVDNSLSEEYFIIERKLSGDESFVKIDSVSSNLTEFIDSDDLNDEITYRVYSKNKLGVSDYSEIAIIILAVNSDYLNDLIVYPNPFKDSFTISKKSVNIKDEQIWIYNIDGKSVEFTTANYDDESIQLRINDNSKIIFVNVKIGSDLISFKLVRR